MRYEVQNHHGHLVMLYHRKAAAIKLADKETATYKAPYKVFDRFAHTIIYEAQVNKNWTTYLEKTEK